MVFNYIGQKEEDQWEVPSYHSERVFILIKKKDQKTPTLTGTSDEGELFLLDWGEK